MNALLVRARDQLGGFGLCALVVLAAVGLFHVTMLSPLRQQAARLDEEIARLARAPSPEHPSSGARTPAAHMAAFYAFFDRRQRIDDWLAKLYATASAAGLELRTADYRLAERRHRMERYQIRFPVSGSYAQVREFMRASLLDIPIMSLDHASFRRTARGTNRIDAELVLTLHLLAR